MEQRLLEEMLEMRGGATRLEKILEEYRQERADALVRVQEIDEIIKRLNAGLNQRRKEVDTDEQ